MSRTALRQRIWATWRKKSVSCRAMAEAYLDQHPEDGVIWALYGDVLRSLGIFEQAKTALHTARGCLVGDEHKPMVFRIAGDLHRDMGHYPSAEECYREGARLEPHLGQWPLFIGIALRRQSRDAEAEECYRRALTLEGARDEYLLNLGYVLQARGALREAKQCYVEALQIDPNYTLAQESLEDVRQAIAFLAESSTA